MFSKKGLMFWGAFSNKKEQLQREKNKTTPPPANKNTFLHVGKQPPMFGKFLFFFNLHSFISAKLCFAENTIKILFSAVHSFCVSQIAKTLFEAPSQNTPFQSNVPFWVFPCACWNPYFCSVWWVCMVPKKNAFPKQIVSTKMPFFSSSKNK